MMTREEVLIRFTIYLLFFCVLFSCYFFSMWSLMVSFEIYTRILLHNFCIYICYFCECVMFGKYWWNGKIDENMNYTNKLNSVIGNYATNDDVYFIIFRYIWQKKNINWKKRERDEKKNDFCFYSGKSIDTTYLLVYVCFQFDMYKQKNYSNGIVIVKKIYEYHVVRTNSQRWGVKMRCGLKWRRGIVGTLIPWQKKFQGFKEVFKI